MLKRERYQRSWNNICQVEELSPRCMGKQDSSQENCSSVQSFWDKILWVGKPVSHSTPLAARTIRMALEQPLLSVVNFRWHFHAKVITRQFRKKPAKLFGYKAMWITFSWPEKTVAKKLRMPLNSSVLLPWVQSPGVSHQQVVEECLNVICAWSLRVGH